MSAVRLPADQILGKLPKGDDSPDERDVKECVKCHAQAVYYNPLNEVVQCHACGELGERRTAASYRRASDVVTLGAYDELCGVVDELAATCAKQSAILYLLVSRGYVAQEAIDRLRAGIITNESKSNI